ncbi:Homeodomain-interacting protein kinase 2 [Penaeus vannamei]|uniref:Homeodomain-interacting protein kinase 2 n=1 Tax=Penaeus vannamei TaxID=6689 RepID=A0A3R7PAY4_PENVA|nr:Homeodomain-interacting protein kinase 2 [Penaeus vannamei]
MSNRSVCFFKTSPSPLGTNRGAQVMTASPRALPAAAAMSEGAAEDGQAPAHTVNPFTPGGALPPPAHHSSGRTVLAAPPAHPLPAHMQPTAVFPTHPQVAAPYTAYTALSPAKSQYQSIWFSE